MKLWARRQNLVRLSVGVKMFSGIALFLAAQWGHAGAINSLNRFLDSTHTLRAEFTQTVTPKKNGKPPDKSSGIIILSRPGKFRWEINMPYKQLLLGDGQKIWMYDPDLNQVTVRPAENALGGTPAALLSGENRARLEKDFILSEIKENSDTLQWLEAKPKAQDSGFEKIRIGFSENLPRAMEIHDSFGQVTSLRFSGIERNPAIDPSLLRFSPPDGADIIGE